MVSISSFITSLATSALIFMVLVFIFTALASKDANRVIYFPARVLAGRSTPGEWHDVRLPWQWLIEAFRATEDDIIRIAGLDAAVYLQLFNTALKIILYSAIVCLPILIPLAITDNAIDIAKRDPNQSSNSTKLDNLSMSNVKEKSTRIWAYLGAMYWVSFVVYYVLARTYKHVVNLRSRAQASEKAMPELFTCLVRDLPKTRKDETRIEQVDEFFREAHPDSYEKCLIVTKLKKPSKIWTELETAKAKLAHAEAVYELSKTKDQPDGVRPQHKTGKFGLYGPKVDSLDYWSEKIKDLPLTLQEEQTRTLADEQQGAAVVFFNSRRAAAEASQSKHSPFADRWQVLPAPEPRAVIWENLPKRFYNRMVREKVITVIVFLLIVFYMIPIAFIAALTTLDNLTEKLPFLEKIVDIGPLKTIIEAYLPQLALIIFLALLPKLLLFLSKQEGIVSKSHLERAACGKMFNFVVFNVFIGFTIFGTLFQSANSISTLTDAGTLSFSDVINLFGKSLPPNASYFITFVALKFFVGYGMELSRFVPLIMYHLKKRYLCKTEAEVKAAWAPGPFDYLSSVPNDLLVIVITLCYAVIAPLILPFGFAYYVVGWFVLRNQALNVYVPNYESGGRMWPHIQTRFLVGLFVAQITAIGFFGIKKFKFAFFLIPLPLITLLYASIVHKVFYPSFKYVSVAMASTEVKEVPTMPAVVKAFTPTCMISPSAGQGPSELDRIDDSKYEDAESQLPSRTSSGIVSTSEHTSADAQPATNTSGHHPRTYEADS